MAIPLCKWIPPFIPTAKIHIKSGNFYNEYYLNFTSDLEKVAAARFGRVGFTPTGYEPPYGATNTNTTESGGRRRTPYASRSSSRAKRMECAVSRRFLLEEKAVGNNQTTTESKIKQH